MTTDSTLRPPAAKRTFNIRGTLVSAPYLLWMIIFIIVPLVLIAVFAFTTTVKVTPAGIVLDEDTIAELEETLADNCELVLLPAGEETEEFDEEAYLEENELDGVTVLSYNEKTIFTLANLMAVSDYMPVLLKSLWLAAVATAFCLVIAYPLAYIISRRDERTQKLLILLTMLPMWMNFLLRTYAWMTLLERNGWINRLLGLVNIGPLNMINTPGAVVLGMVYNYLPFMILPIHSIMTKIDNTTIEAAADLGANRSRVFTRIVLPLSLPGVASGITMVFVPAVSTFIISRMLGGGTNLLIGDLIDLQFLGNAYNPNLGAAISLVLMVFILLCMSITNSLDPDENEGGVLL